jgi:3-phosphoshikimate 1-carboxyvinyltransferase
MKYVISEPQNPIRESIRIPSSKSISNRMLIIRSLAGSISPIQNLSDSDDTSVLVEALDNEKNIIDVGHAGTSMRFLAAYLCTQPGDFVLTGSLRMKQRPIGPLVDALKQIGAGITYLEKKGYPPLRIVGGRLTGGTIEIDAGISSQFISALMMIGPMLEGGLIIRLKGDVVSASYIKMTLSLMNSCGTEACFEANQITVPRGSYSLGEFSVESDWSGASYWFQVAALLPGSEITLPHLSRSSLQGDAALVQIFDPLGVQTAFGKNGLTLRSQEVNLPEHFDYDFTGCPDLVQTLAVSLCALGIPFRFNGTITLRVKETDRLTALQKELKRLGYVLTADTRGEWLEWDGTRCEPEKNPHILTYHDHRMAMAFAPMAIKQGSIIIVDPEVVSKSYPGFWKDLEKAGFGITLA